MFKTFSFKCVRRKEGKKEIKNERKKDGTGSS
jgi:hypothetical protein